MEVFHTGKTILTTTPTKTTEINRMKIRLTRNAAIKANAKMKCMSLLFHVVDRKRKFILEFDINEKKLVTIFGGECEKYYVIYF